MNKILLISRREYLTRVKKKSFIIMTFLGPLLIALVYGLAFWLATSDDTSDKDKIISVVDESGLVKGQLKDQKKFFFNYVDSDLIKAKSQFDKANTYALLFVPSTFSIDEPIGIQLYSYGQPGLLVHQFIEEQINDLVEVRRIKQLGIEKEVLQKIKSKITLQTIKMSDVGEEESFTSASFVIGLLASILIYISILLYGVQVMKGVIEEKTSRIMEVIVSSVKPFQLMMGKIVGIAAVGLTQFLLWIILTIVVTGAVSSLLSSKTSKFNPMTQMKLSSSHQMDNMDEEKVIQEVFKAINSINFPMIFFFFVFYFLGGYLLYSALFAAIGSAVDSEAETQQFMLPVTLPLVFAFIVVQFIIKNPEGPVAFWFSIIPLTSPIVMMVRIPFGVPWYELVLSMALLILGFIASVWLAARIFRVGVLMWGKKVSYKELSKWIFYK